VVLVAAVLLHLFLVQLEFLAAEGGGELHRLQLVRLRDFRLVLLERAWRVPLPMPVLLLRSRDVMRPHGCRGNWPLLHRLMLKRGMTKSKMKMKKKEKEKEKGGENRRRKAKIKGKTKEEEEEEEDGCECPGCVSYSLFLLSGQFSPLQPWMF
jgi:hypothetical protein